ncbi:putative MFS monocarboxylate transporter (Mct) [Aspergillus clavatus NRRL 1]|uniref:MFS monocarboxylate transporter (Mct), putative n=1 Tax=Aspergillus clavatus (strain ATCC 1007 / CBS 513.65 / DSM 816 / NCTC 3887 / NRRL 1 / QM 1276 / 107) TaxID=344612 RepID=A1C861_ASPCL|nr:MFS monocarboxylate transporter (Mct), putative [Aspergillus clavatus NRRL 1]EAW14582.1 MFS monocarboxylate transporter (Mct), putative [Aspergillus clavatus NRRL 1]
MGTSEPNVDTEKHNVAATVEEDSRGQMDEGPRAWTVVAGAWCCLFCGFGWVNAIGIFQEYYQHNQLRNYSASSISWILSLEPFVLFAAGIVLGRVFDNYGPRWMLVIGTFLHVFGLMMISISSEYYQLLLAQGICSPLGASFVFYPASACTATWFDKRRALAFGIMSSGSSIGGVVFPAMLSRLLPRVGFGWSLRIAAFVVLALLIVANLTVRSRIAPVPRRIRFSDYVGPFTEVPFVLLMVAACLGFWAMFVPINYVILEAQEDGVSRNLAEYLLTILNAASLPGRILPGYFGDKLGRFNVMIAMCALSALTILVLWIPGTLLAPGSAAVYVIFSLLYGFASGAFVGMVPALLSQITEDMTKTGVRQGVLYTCMSIATLTGSPIAGAILSRQQGKYWGLQVFAGVMMVGSVVFFIIARVVLGGASLKKRL